MWVLGRTCPVSHDKPGVTIARERAKAKSGTVPRFLKFGLLAILLLVLFYQLFFRYSGKVGEVTTARDKSTVKIDFIPPDKNGVIGVTGETQSGNMRVLLVAVLENESAYSALPPSLSSLGPRSAEQPVSGKAANLLDSPLASGKKNGYVYSYVPNASSKSFTITADPSGNSSSTAPHYFSDQTAVVRVESGRTATVSSRPESERPD